MTFFSSSNRSTSRPKSKSRRAESALETRKHADIANHMEDAKEGACSLLFKAWLGVIFFFFLESISVRLGYRTPRSTRLGVIVDAPCFVTPSLYQPESGQRAQANFVFALPVLTASGFSTLSRVKFTAIRCTVCSLHASSPPAATCLTLLSKCVCIAAVAPGGVFTLLLVRKFPLHAALRVHACIAIGGDDNYADNGSHRLRHVTKF